MAHKAIYTKSSPIRHLKDKDIDEITAKINTRPRKKLNFSTPIEEFFNYLLKICTCLLNSQTVFIFVNYPKKNKMDKWLFKKINYLCH